MPVLPPGFVAFMAATAEALRRHAVVNSQWRDDGLLLLPEVNIGMAVALDEGLILVSKHQALRAYDVRILEW